MVQIKVPNKLYVRLYAGMGDFYKRYFCHSTWRCIKDLKEKHPEVSIYALLVSQTIPALSLVDYHPYIDKVIKPKMHLREFKKEDVTKYVKDYTFLSPKLAKHFKQEQPKIYLSEEDQSFINRVASCDEKYIVLHPFAGDTHGINTRTPLLPKEYLPIINALIEAGYKVMLLGKSWQRIKQGTTDTRVVNENFPWKKPGLINLIDKTNVRTAAELIKKSSGFVGTASCFMCATWSIGNIPSVIITSERWRKPLNEMPWAQDKINLPYHKMIYLNKDRSPQKLKGIANVTANWF